LGADRPHADSLRHPQPERVSRRTRGADTETGAARDGAVRLLHQSASAPRASLPATAARVALDETPRVRADLVRGGATSTVVPMVADPGSAGTRPAIIGPQLSGRK